MLRNSQNIQESVQNYTSGYSQRKVYECRVCLEQMGSEQLLQVCDCKGSNEAIHKKCLIEWISESNKKYRRMLQFYYKCEICLTQIELQTQVKITCKQDQISPQTQEQASACSIISTITILVAIGTFGVCLYFGVIQQKSRSINRFLIFGIILSSIAILSTIILYLFQQAIDFNIKVLNLKQKKQSPFNDIKKNIKNNRVMPIPINQISKQSAILAQQSQQKISYNKFQKQTKRNRKKQSKLPYPQKPHQQNQHSLEHIKQLFSIQ